MISLLQIFWEFFKIGCFTFGGGYAMVLMIQRELVEKHKWIESEEFLPVLALAQSAPGPMVVNTAIIAGYRLREKKGGLIAALGVILPSFVIMLVIALVLGQINENPVVERVFKGVRPAVVGLIFASVVMFAKKVKYWTYPVCVITAIAITLGVSPLIIIGITVVLALVYAKVMFNRMK